MSNLPPVQLFGPQDSGVNSPVRFFGPKDALVTKPAKRQDSSTKAKAVKKSQAAKKDPQSVQDAEDTPQTPQPKPAQIPTSDSSK